MAAQLRALAARTHIDWQLLPPEAWIHIATSRPAVLFALVRVFKWLWKLMQHENVAFVVAFSFIKRQTPGTRWHQWWADPRRECDVLVGGFVGKRWHGIVFDHHYDDQSSSSSDNVLNTSSSSDNSLLSSSADDVVFSIHKVGFYDATQPLTKRLFHDYPYDLESNGQLADLGQIPSAWASEKKARIPIMPLIGALTESNSVYVDESIHDMPSYMYTWQHDGQRLTHLLCTSQLGPTTLRLVLRFHFSDTARQANPRALVDLFYFIDARQAGSAALAEPNMTPIYSCGDRSRTRAKFATKPVPNPNLVAKCEDPHRLIEIWLALIEMKMWI